MLVHSRDRILPELSESLGRYALERMAARGVEFRLSTRVLDAGEGSVKLSDGEIRTQTLAWTAGSAPSPWLKAVGLDTDKRGAVVVDSTMAVPGRDRTWALGDCAALKDGRSGDPCPPTAQFALREGRTLARNIRRSLAGKAPEPFHFDSLGALCVVGYQTACAELTVPFSRGKQVRFSGLLAWMMWRGIYVSKLPGLERKIRVLVNWTFELFFPRDIVQTGQVQAAYAEVRRLRQPGGSRATRSAPPPPRSARDPNVEARLADLERELREANLARERARRAAREAAAAARAETQSRPRASDEDLGYVSTDDSFMKILADARDELFGRASEARDESGGETRGETRGERPRAAGRRPRRGRAGGHRGPAAGRASRSAGRAQLSSCDEPEAGAVY